MRLFVNGKLNMPEYLYRMQFWINYAKTGATADVEKAISRLDILHKILRREQA